MSFDADNPKLTAYALGELDEDERAEVEIRLLERRPRLLEARGPLGERELRGLRPRARRDCPRHELVHLDEGLGEHDQTQPAAVGDHRAGGGEELRSDQPEQRGKQTSRTSLVRADGTPPSGRSRRGGRR